METILLIAVMTVGGWFMYAIGYVHGRTVGAEETLDKIAERQKLNHKLYDLTYK